mmetsp:Transcript_36671/g.89649  ORF Transcript_36671/g.89649 Transcript_36671/m.89649 type:complete len:382 (+) Transcript_36671:227-1372(+)
MEEDSRVLRSERDAALKLVEDQQLTISQLRNSQREISDLYTKLRAEHAALNKRAKDAAATSEEQIRKLETDKQNISWQLNGAWAEVERTRAQCAEDMRKLVEATESSGKEELLRAQLALALENETTLRNERAELVARSESAKRASGEESDPAAEQRRKQEMTKAVEIEKQFFMGRIVSITAKLEQTQDEVERQKAHVEELQHELEETQKSLVRGLRSAELERKKVRTLEQKWEEQGSTLKSERAKLECIRKQANEQTLSLKNELEDNYFTLQRHQKSEQTLQLRISLLQKALEDVDARVKSDADDILAELVSVKIQLAEAQEETVILKGDLCKRSGDLCRDPASIEVCKRSSTLAGMNINPVSPSSRRGSPTRVSRTFHLF